MNAPRLFKLRPPLLSAFTGEIPLSFNNPPFLPSFSYSILASLFRQPSPRSLVPPSSFPSGLQPIGSKDLNGSLQRRVSRTDLDFEQALRGEGTVVLKESLDVDALGVWDQTHSSTSSSTSFASPSPPPKTPYSNLQPATPTIVPPTPSPTSIRGAGTSASSRTHESTPDSPEIFYDAEDSADLQTKRRSMYRAPGTASSPDLATLLRKAKAKENNAEKDARSGNPSLPPLTPNRLIVDDTVTKSSRSRPSTAVSSPQSASSTRIGTPLTRGKSKPDLGVSPSSSGVTNPDWVLTSPRSMSSMKEKVSRGLRLSHDADMGAQASKSSVRAKTTAFFGKMLGTASTRERSVRVICYFLVFRGLNR